VTIAGYFSIKFIHNNIQNMGSTHADKVCKKIMKIVTVIGARPQFIKAATVSRVLRRIPNIQETLVHTGQHYDANMSRVFFEELDIPEPGYNLEIGSLSHGAQTGRMLEAIENILLDEKPDMVIVYGDTNSTLAGTLAAVKLHIPVAHVEAGLRSFNRTMPEEINRILADHSADILFAPTQEAVKHLKHEGIAGERIHLVGDVMYDAALYYTRKASEKSLILDQLGIKSKDYILATVHRAENTDDPVRLNRIFKALSHIAKDITVILPLHPRTQAFIARDKEIEALSRQLRIIEPVGYLDMVMLEKHAQLIATDSGGVQKEAFFHRIPCVTLRDETEWVELVEHGYNCLVGADDKKIIHSVKEMMGRTFNWEIPLYGKGNACTLIAKKLQGIVSA